jgi:hypothetical protein
MTSPAKSVEVHEVHDWPERTCPGPRIVVWYGCSRKQAEAVCRRLKEREHGTFFYEVVNSDE